jgi:hypothetical protein
MPQATEIETQSEEQGLTLLHRQRATGRASREPALHQDKQALDQRSVPIERSRKRPAHLSAHPVGAAGFLPAFGGNHSLSPELLPDIDVIPFAIELCVGQDQPDARLLGSRLDDRRQIRTIALRAASRDLQQQELLVQIDHHPLKPVPPR